MARPVEDLTYTVPEAAQALGVCGDTVRTLIANGDLPSLHIGRRVLVSRKALDEWVAANADGRFAGPGGAKSEHNGMP